jgi:hypothetical protein
MFAKVVEEGITTDYYRALYEVEGGVDVPLAEGEAPPNSDYDPSQMPVCRRVPWGKRYNKL